jgi:hypothetical protein
MGGVGVVGGIEGMERREQRERAKRRAAAHALLQDQRACPWRACAPHRTADPLLWHRSGGARLPHLDTPFPPRGPRILEAAKGIDVLVHRLKGDHDPIIAELLCLG